MTASTSRAAYADCFDIFDRALESPRGIRILTTTEGVANNLITRLNYSRLLSRAESREVYPADDPNFGLSPYDGLVVRRPRWEGNKWWVYIEPRAVIGEIEELTKSA